MSDHREEIERIVMEAYLDSIMLDNMKTLGKLALLVFAVWSVL